MNQRFIFLKGEHTFSFFILPIFGTNRKTMKTIYSIVLVLLGGLLLAQPPKGKATPGTVYGAKFEKTDVKSANELPALLKTQDTVLVKVRATVVDVCSAKGCWLTFKVDGDAQGFVKMYDYGFFVPMDLIGKTVVLDGKSFIKTTSVEDQKHYAEDAKKSQAEIDAITQAKKEIRFIAKGIIVE